MTQRATYPIILLPSRLNDALAAQPELPTFGIAQPRENAFPPDIPAGKSLLSTGYSLFGLKKQADELLAPERQAARARYEAAVQAWEQAKSEFDAAERAKLTPFVIRRFQFQRVAPLLESSTPDALGESFAPVGVAEMHLFECLNEHFPGRILRRRMLGTGKQAYHPDFLYFDPAKRLRIDIELDEPYGLGHKLPIHFVDEEGQSSDAQRDEAFLRAGWPVVRFSEQQAVENPDGCAKVVADLVERLTGVVTPSLNDTLRVTPHPRWTRDEANLMASQNVRAHLTAKIKRVDAQPAQQQKPAKVFTPSPNQQKIFQFLEQGQGHGLVIAVAGSGKSTTLLEAAKVIKRKQPKASILMLAFNKSIAKELSDKLKEAEVRGVETSTLNAFGHGRLGKRKPQPKVVTFKPARMVKQAAQVVSDRPLLKSDVDNAAKLYSLFQSYIHLDPANPDDYKWLSTQYNMSGSEYLQPVVVEALQRGRLLYQFSNMITYDDQNYLPVFLNLEMPTYDYVFVDECQDLTQTQLEMVRRIAGERGRLLFVGDPQQAIMGFRGADNNSVENIRRLPSTPTELPLTVTYRCPKTHVELARKIMPDIRAADHAKQGHVYRISWDQAFEYVRERDLMFGRWNKEVDRIVLELFARGITIQYEEKRPTSSDQPEEEEAQQNASARVVQVVAELRKAAVNFQPSAGGLTKPTVGQKDQPLKVLLPWVLHRLYQQAEQWGGGSLVDFVQAMTHPDPRMGVRVSSAHQAKGLEAERVFVMGEALFGERKTGKPEWEHQQEQNLLYVALTRAKDALYLVGLP